MMLTLLMLRDVSGSRKHHILLVPMYTHSCTDTNMHTHENRADVGLSL